MDCLRFEPIPTRMVREIRRGDRWVVQVLEETGTFEREFVYEKHAAAYAKGQRIRLGLSIAP